MIRIVKLIYAAAKETPRLFFAPLIGAYKGIKQEYRLIDEEIKKNSSVPGN